MKDEFGFLQNVSNWCNHRPLLLMALEATTGAVLELGVGEGSTNHLHRYCEAKNRYLSSWDSNKTWLEKFKHLESPIHKLSWNNNDWSSVPFDINWSVVLVDHAPGERRWEDIKRLANLAEILVIHDSEPVGAGNYMLDKIWHLFKYRKDYKSSGAWATAVSNSIDVSKLEA